MSDSSENSPGSEPGENASSDDTVNVTLEQWKLYTQTTRDVSNRRLKTNRYYKGLVVVTVGGVGIAARFNAVGPFIYLVVGVVGVAVSLLRMLHVVSYQQLNSGKYQVLHDLEAELPHQPFTDEWDLLKHGRDPTTYIPHTSVEIWWPRVALWVFGGMALYGGQ